MPLVAGDPLISDNLRAALDLSLFWEYRVVLLRGLWMSLYVFGCSAVIALAAGLAVALMRTSRWRALRWAGTLHTEISRNSPDYIMIVWVHFVLPLLLGALLARRVEFNPFVSAVIALGYVYSGYFAETFRAGIEAVPRGHIEAANAFGMSNTHIVWRIVLPQVVRRMLPESTNQFISMFKATSIVSLIAVPDLMYQVSMVTAQEMRPLPLYTGAALAYFVIVFCAASLLELLSKRWRSKVFA
ncbi:MAG: amino acid ABC transporter permease [Rubrivivax sp.]